MATMYISSTTLSAAGHLSSTLSPRPLSPESIVGDVARISRPFRGPSVATDSEFHDVLASKSRTRFLFGLRRRPRRFWMGAARPRGAETRLLCRASLRSHEDSGIVNEIADLFQNLQSLKGLVIAEFRTVGPEMRDRVSRLFDRATVLQEAADRATSSGIRLPSQLTANLKALQREYGSLENIIRLTVEASPSIARVEATLGKRSTVGDVSPNLFLENSKPDAAAFQSLIRESVVQPVKNAPKYAMSAPSSQGSAPLSAFRAEIERRVIEQLTGKKLRGSSPPTELLSSPSSTSLQSDDAPIKSQLAEFLPETETRNGHGSTPSGDAEVIETGAFIGADVKPQSTVLIQVFEQKMRKINMVLSEARAKVSKVTAEVTEKEAMVTSVKENVLADKELFIQRVREVTGDVQKTFSAEDLEAAVNLGLKDVEQALEEGQSHARLLNSELKEMEESVSEQLENWRKQKEELESRLKREHEQTLGLSRQLEKQHNLMMEQQEEWNLQKTSLQSELETVVGKWQDVRKKRTKERAQLADKKLKVKLLEQELARLHESMEEADRIRLSKKEAMYTTVRKLISQMVLSARASGQSNEHASNIAQEMEKLQEENQALELSRKAAEQKAQLAEVEVLDIKSNLSQVGKEVANLQGELLSREKTAALEKFFAIMAQLIKQESDNIDESLETGDLLDNDLNGDGLLEKVQNGNLISSEIK